MNLNLLKNFNKNFGAKVFATFSIFFLLISASFIFYFIYNQSQTMTNDLIKKGILLARILAHGSRIGVFSENDELLNNSVEAIFQQKEVLEVLIFNLEGELLKKRERSETMNLEKSVYEDMLGKNRIFEKVKENRSPFYVEVNDKLEFWSPVISGSNYGMEETLFFEENSLRRKDRVIGLIRITIDKKTLNKQIKDLLFESTLLGIIFFIIGCGVTYLVARGITRPLNRLTEGVKALEMGSVVKKVPEETEDEIGKLAKAFNKMTESLQRRKKALQESEEKYRNILESIEEGYYESDIFGNFTFVNDSISKILGYSKDQLVGMNTQRNMDQQNAKKANQVFGKVYNTGKPEKGFDLELVGKDGAKILVEISASVMKNSTGQPIGFRGILRDVTERRLAEEEKRRLIAQLQQAQKLEAIGMLAGGVAHDLNNVLSGVINYPELLLMEIPQDSPLTKHILTIKKSGEKAAAIVHDLLTLARRGVAVTEVINLNDIISEYLKSPEHRKLKLYHPKVEEETNFKSDLLNILGSPVHLSKTVMNLVSNAAEAMPDGGKIYMSTENQYIDKPVRGYDDVQEGEYVVFTVSDTGLGISPEDRERIFEPFYTKKVMGRSGTGLGMAVIWGTVKDHKGYIDLQSNECKGTTFTLYFPVTRQEKTRVKSLIPIEDYMGKGESILVVDDVKEQREIAIEMLKKLGYSATSVSSGEEAVEFMRNNSADLLVLDMIMDPGIDGLDTYKRILELHPGQKAIIVSGFSESDHIREAQRLGAGAYLKKPYLLETFGLAVRDELSMMIGHQ